MTKKISYVSLLACLILLMMPTIPAIEYRTTIEASELCSIGKIKIKDTQELIQLLQLCTSELKEEDITFRNKLQLHLFNFIDKFLKNKFDDKDNWINLIESPKFVQIFRKSFNNQELKTPTKTNEQLTITNKFLKILVMTLAIACIAMGVFIIYFGSNGNILVGGTLIIIGLILGVLSLLGSIG